MSEKQITRDLLVYLRSRGGVHFKLADRATIGLPDIASTVNGRTTWLEVKVVDDPELEMAAEVNAVQVPASRVVTPTLQLQTMLWLEQHGRAWYVLFISKPRDRAWWTAIVSPKHLQQLKREGKCFTAYGGKRMEEVFNKL